LERGKTAKQASIDAMGELMGPIVGVTLVLMSVFIPPAFMPGITGQMYRQFALVIAATAFISAINAATLKPTQCALWLRQPDPNRRKNFFFRGFNSVYERLEKFYVRLISRMVARSRQMAVIGLLLIALAGWGLTRIPTGFIPTEDQGYAMVTVQLPDGASLERTQEVMDRLAEICQKNAAIERTIAIGGMSPLDNNASLANAGIIYLMFKDWSKRGKGEDLLSIYNDVSLRLARSPEGLLRMTDLAAQTTLTSSGITRVVDRLVERGLVTRRSCATDRRTTYAVITDTGHDLLAAVLPGQIQLIQDWLVDPLTATGALAEFEAALRTLRDHTAPCATAGADGSGLVEPGAQVPAQAAAPA